MKTIIMALVVVGVMVALLNLPSNTVTTYVKESTVEVQPVEEVIEEDTIEKARQELERINAELDAKETELLEERAAIDLELERLRETRVSFQ